MPIITVVLTWKGASFDIKLDTCEPVEVFRLRVQAVTAVPCVSQKIMGFPGGVLKANSWTEVALKGDKINVILSGESATAPAPASETSTSDVLQHSQLPMSPEGALMSSSSLAKSLKVTVRTTQGAVTCIPDLPANCLIGRIKYLLSLPPRSCGQPLSMKLVYRGTFVVFLPFDRFLSL
jgi:hypothetical protein